MGALKALTERNKSISYFPGWSEPEPESSYTWFNAPLDVAGVTEAGLVLHGGCLANAPDCNVSFEIAVIGMGGHRRISLARLCWRSLRGGHTNPRTHGPEVLRGLRVGPTHYHSFTANWIAAERRMRGRNLPFAEDVNEVLETFEAARDLAGALLRISNIGVVMRPEWEYDLFHGSAR